MISTTAEQRADGNSTVTDCTEWWATTRKGFSCSSISRPAWWTEKKKKLHFRKLARQLNVYKSRQPSSYSGSDRPWCMLDSCAAWLFIGMAVMRKLSRSFLFWSSLASSANLMSSVCCFFRVLVAVTNDLCNRLNLPVGGRGGEYTNLYKYYTYVLFII